MTIRKIVVPVDGTDATRLSLETAFRLGRDVEAHVEVVHARADPRLAVPLVGEGMSGAMIEELIDLTEKESAARAAKAREMFERTRETTGVALADAPTSTGPSTRWIERVGSEDEVLVRRGRLADLLVVARPTAQMETPSVVTFNAAVFESGRPVLVTPKAAAAAAAAPLGRAVAIAWNGSAEAARAVSAALPLLARADSVHILNVDTDDFNADTGDLNTDTGDGPAQGLDGLAEFLAWHGVSAQKREVAKDDGSVGGAIVAACADADMLVMGAYTHSRLRELILGGVTRHVLEHAPLALFMAH